MKKRTASEIREAFLTYYANQGHTREKSSSLVPANDPTLLFTSAGMVQFKDVFTGNEKRAYTRATTAQKCLRAGGKHNDLENVGHTGRHHTFFEMLGNFSFGDYFKKEAIHFAWDLITNVLELPKDRLHVTVFREDNEAFDIWHKQEGVPLDRIYRFDEKDNFWSAGDVGPCGPCTEIYFDQGEAFNTGDPEKDRMGGDGDRFLEFYNLVFMQYNRDANGNLSPLPRPSVDTGMGLERITSIIQSAQSNYDNDIFNNLISSIQKLSGKTYTVGSMDETSVAMRVVADHLRAVSFLIADGVLPSNEGRGYVLRRILRRAVRYGKKLGFESSFMEKLVPALIETMSAAYPELKEKEAFIRKAIKSEEEKFFSTLEKGLSILSEELAKIPAKSALPGAIAFLLYDSFGFPLDLTRIIAEESGYSVDEAGFDKAMEKQKNQSKAEKTEGGKTAEVYKQLVEEKLFTEFTGYTSCTGEGKIIAIIQNGAKTNKIANTGAKPLDIEIIFDRSPFYAEGGGQAGDSGEIFLNDKCLAKVKHVKHPLPEISVVYASLEANAEIAVGTNYGLKATAHSRSSTAANHSATHLLHWALRHVLGTHVKQAGSLVTPEFLRFDFTHFQALTGEELNKVEKLINDKISKNESVGTKVMQKEDAIQAGAMALFGEKYDSDVRVVKIGDFSTELCGGTHVQNTSQIRLFVTQSEGGIAAGVRRIIALTGENAISFLKEKANIADALKEKLKATSNEELLKKVDRLQEKEKELEKKLEAIQAQSVTILAKELSQSAKTIAGIKVLTHNLKDGNMDILRNLSDRLKENLGSGIIALGTSDQTQNKAFLLITITSDLTQRFNANKLLQSIAPHIEGKGGGKPEQAQAGGPKIQGINAALQQILTLIS